VVFIRVVRVGLELRAGVVEGRQVGVVRARRRGEVPGEGEGCGQVADHALALVGDLLGVGVLVAHHDQDVAVHCQQFVEGVVTFFDLVDVMLDFRKFFLVVFEDLTGVGQHGQVPVDVFIVVLAVGTNVVQTPLDAFERRTQGLCGNEHVGGLANLQLVAVLSEERAFDVKRIDSFTEVGDIGEGGRGGAAVAEEVMVGVGIVVGLVGLLVRLEAASVGKGADEGCNHKFHWFSVRLNFISLPEIRDVIRLSFILTVFLLLNCRNKNEPTAN